MTRSELTDVQRDRAQEVAPAWVRAMVDCILDWRAEGAAAEAIADHVWRRHVRGALRAYGDEQAGGAPEELKALRQKVAASEALLIDCHAALGREQEEHRKTVFLFVRHPKRTAAGFYIRAFLSAVERVFLRAPR